MADEQNKETNDLTESHQKNLTDKNILFLHWLRQGKPTTEAYTMAGYQGTAHAAYELRSYLKNELASMLNGEGLGTREGVLLKLKKLQDLPLAQTMLSVKEALEILKLEAKLQPKNEREEKPKITPIIINIQGNATIEPLKEPGKPANVIEVTPIDITDEADSF